jgi:hypothetical protein
MMTQIPITMTQAKTLAALLHELRPDWDERGLLAAIHGAKDRAGNFDLAIAAIRAAGQPTNRTPAIIGMEGPHWHPEQAAPEPAKRPGGVTRCIECGGFHHPADEHDPPEAERAYGRGAQAARRALRGGTP